MEITRVIPDGMQGLYDKIKYAPAVRAGNVLWVSGQIGHRRGHGLVADKQEQFEQVFDNLRVILQEAGTDFAHVVEVTSFHTDLRDLPAYIEVRDRYFTEPYPAWTAVGVTMLGGQAGCFLEVKLVAVVPD